MHAHKHTDSVKDICQTNLSWYLFNPGMTYTKFPYNQMPFLMLIRDISHCFILQMAPDGRNE